MVLPKYLKINKILQLKETDIPLPSSKSESNRALIINSLAENKGELMNLSEARDTQTLQRLLTSEDEVLDVLDAGTTMRFLLAYLTVRNKEHTLTGTKRMCERPVKVLVDALRSLGGKIDYLQQEGYPPVHVMGMKKTGQHVIQVRGDISSQYISALLMIAPLLPQGLALEIIGNIGSRPYIEMTLALMKKFGVDTDWNQQIILVKPGEYAPVTYTIESDWSGASYWFSFVALAETAKLKLLGLRENSLQGDIEIVRLMEKLGVKTEFSPEGIILSQQEADGPFVFDFKDCPDLAQTVAVVCAAKNISCTMLGLESLRIKETDRIAALQAELGKIGARLQEERKGEWLLTPGEDREWMYNPLEIKTYKDHRMAMAFAPLALFTDVFIENPDVVKKSYPGFWKDMSLAGAVIE